jgi:YVTN family beta-propeller protein
VRSRGAILALALATSCGGSSPAKPTGSTVVARIAVGGQPCGVVAANGSVWVTDAERGRLLLLQDDKLVRDFPVDATPCELTFGYGSLWIATQSGLLDRVDPATGKVVAHVKVGDTSYEPLAAFGCVWVTNRGSNSVSQIDPATNKVVRTIATPFVNAGGIVDANGSLWVGNDASGDTELLRIDPGTGRITKVKAGDRPAFVAAAGGSVWVANQNDHNVTRLDAATGAVRGTVPAGSSPVNLAALPGARPEVWVPDDVGNVLTRIDATTGAVIETLHVGTGPAVVAPDGTDVWVTNFGDGSVWHIRPSARSNG